jgi:hypothetical protein
MADGFSRRDDIQVVPYGNPDSLDRKRDDNVIFFKLETGDW